MFCGIDLLAAERHGCLLSEVRIDRLVLLLLSCGRQAKAKYVQINIVCRTVLCVVESL